MGTNYYLRPKEPAVVEVYLGSGDGREMARSFKTYTDECLYRCLAGGNPVQVFSDYLREKRWDEIELDDDYGLHLCKISAGWRPLLQLNPGVGIEGYEGFRSAVMNDEFVVVDEYGEEQPDKAAFLSSLEERNGSLELRGHTGDSSYYHADGWDFCKVWFQ